MVKDRRSPNRRGNPERQMCVVHVRLVEDERELLGILANRQGCSMAEYLRHMMRIGARSAVIAQAGRQARDRREAREADLARQAAERERREVDEYLATPEGQAALTEAKRKRSEQMIQEVIVQIRQDHERRELAKA